MPTWGLNLRSVVLITLLLAGVGIFVVLQTKDSTLQQPATALLAKGMPAPNFTLPNLKGKDVSLSKYRGKLVFLNIWATWCPPCVEEMPSMEKLYQALKGQAFEILAVSIDASGKQAVMPFMQKHKLSFPVLLDSAGTLKNLYRTTGVPESVIIDKEGRIIEKIVGPRNWGSPEAIRLFQDLLRR
jgi:peroxiredoxin